MAEPVKLKRAGVDRKFVTALARGLDVLRSFGPRDRWLTNQELAARTGLAKATVARLAHTLVQTGHLRYSEAQNGYALGQAALRLGFAALGHMDVRRAARPLMASLSDDTNAAVHLAVNDGPSMFLVDTYRNARSFLVDIGPRVPLATTSMGRAWVSGLPPAQRRSVLEDLRQAHADGWPAVKKGLDQALEEYERKGYCLGLGDWRREVHAIAVPLVLAGGPEPVVFGCSGAAFQLPAETLESDIAPRLLTLVGNVRAALSVD
jgi:DNA-binding IclR family transcriptional regulator